ncbi:MAG: hypothetical protein JSW08_01085 [archaeon]|nr:MAG: hypothetical protein JSW08_01085 [archaeon]
MINKKIIMVIILIALLIPITLSASEKKQGIEIKLDSIDSIRVVYDGSVEMVRHCENPDTIRCQQYGKSVTLKHKTGANVEFYTFYAGLDQILVSENEEDVEKADSIGKSSSVFFAIASHVDAQGIPSETESYDPLCFFYKSQLNAKKIDYDESKINYDSAACDRARNVLGIKEASEKECREVTEGTCRTQPGCWYDESREECKDCPSKCEGDSPFLGRANKFNTKESCEQNLCSFSTKCRWKEDEEKCVEGTPSEPGEEKLSKVALVSSESGTGFTSASKLVEKSDPDVEVCAVVHFNNQKYSSSKVAEENSENIGTWQSSMGNLEFEWYKIVPYGRHVRLEGIDQSYTAYGSNDPDDHLDAKYNLGMLKDQNGEKVDIIQYKQERLDGSDWCIGVDGADGTKWYRVEVEFSGETYSSPGKRVEEDELNYYPEIYHPVRDTLLETEAYFLGIENVHRISRKSDYCKENGISSFSNDYLGCQFIETIESFKKVPFYGMSFEIEGRSMADFYKAIECNTLLSAAARIVYPNKDFPNNIKEFPNSDDIGLVREGKLSDLLGEPIEFRVGNLLFIRRVSGDITHSAVLYEDRGAAGRLDQEDILIMTDNICIETNAPAPEVVNMEGNICYQRLKAYLNYDVLLLEII